MCHRHEITKAGSWRLEQSHRDCKEEAIHTREHSLCRSPQVCADQPAPARHHRPQGAPGPDPLLPDSHWLQSLGVRPPSEMLNNL